MDFSGTIKDLSQYHRLLRLRKRRKANRQRKQRNIDEWGAL